MIFTIDYELFGNGAGNLIDHVIQPTKTLKKIFDTYDSTFVIFFEAAEFKKISEFQTDKNIRVIENQVYSLYQDDYEIALHIHPQWFNAVYRGNNWILDFDEYNLSNLNEEKINNYLNQSLNYLRKIIKNKDYLPLAYRAGGWLIQPSEIISNVLFNNGIKIDSSVFKGGRQLYRGFNFIPSIKNPYWWKFNNNVNKPEINGKLFEIPIYTRMVPFWEMYSSKRRKIIKENNMNKRYIDYSKSIKETLFNYFDMLRLFYPKKLDFSKMTFSELKFELDNIINKDMKSYEEYKPIVLIGHTKNLNDFDTIIKTLDYLKSKGINVGTFHDALININTRVKI